MATDNLNLTTISSANETIGTHFPAAYNANMEAIDSAVGDNTSDISALDTRLTTAEGDIDAAQDDISALNLSLAQRPVKFSPTFSTTPTFLYDNCFYDPISKIVHVDILAYWSTAASSRGLIGSFPYAPAEGETNLWCLLGQGPSSSQAIRAERAYLTAAGGVMIGNFIGGYTTASFLAIKGSYRTA